VITLQGPHFGGAAADGGTGTPWSEQQEKVWNTGATAAAVYNEVVICKADSSERNDAVRSLLRAICAHGELPHCHDDLAGAWDDKLWREEQERLRLLEEERLRKLEEERLAREEAERARHGSVVVVTGPPFAGKTALIMELVRRTPSLLFTVPHSTVADHDFEGVEKRASEDGKIAILELSNFGEVCDLPTSEESSTEHDAAFVEGQDARYTRVKLTEASETEPYFIEVQPPSRTEQEARVSPPAEEAAEPNADDRLEAYRARRAVMDEKMAGWAELNLRSWFTCVNNTVEQSVDDMWEQIAQWFPHLVEQKQIAEEAAEAEEAAAALAAEEADAAAAAAAEREA